MIKPGSVLPHSTPNDPVPRENGGGGAVPWVSTDDSPNVRDDVQKQAFADWLNGDFFEPYAIQYAE